MLNKKALWTFLILTFTLTITLVIIAWLVLIGLIFAIPQFLSTYSNLSQ